MGWSARRKIQPYGSFYSRVMATVSRPGTILPISAPKPTGETAGKPGVPIHPQSRQGHPSPRRRSAGQRGEASAPRRRARIADLVFLADTVSQMTPSETCALVPEAASSWPPPARPYGQVRAYAMFALGEPSTGARPALACGGGRTPGGAGLDRRARAWAGRRACRSGPRAPVTPKR